MKIRNCFYLLIVNIISSVLSYLGIVIFSKNVSSLSMVSLFEFTICLFVYGFMFIVVSAFIKINKKELLLNVAVLFVFKLLLLLVSLYYEDSVFYYIELFIDTITIYSAELFGTHFHISQIYYSMLALLFTALYCSGVFFVFSKLFKGIQKRK